MRRNDESEMRKVSLPDAQMVERGMTPEQRAEHEKRMRQWRREGAEDGPGR